MKTAADVLDMFATAMAILAVVFFFYSLPTIDTGPEFIQIGLACLMMAIIPYCIAGALHRLWVRR
jgi:hypothetical protein